MKAALAIPRVTVCPETNLREVACLCDAAQEAELVLFPEASLTGLINDDIPEDDLPLGQTVPGAATECLGDVARRNSQHIAFGLLERAGDCLYDSAVLVDPSGRVALHYRRVQPQWHGRNADSRVYREGTELPSADTALGRVGFLICGDMFDDEIVAAWKERGLDYALFPCARSFSDGSFDQGRWDREEESEYVGRMALLGCTVLMVNQLEDRALTDYPAFGGAIVVTPDGGVLARRLLGVPGILWVDL